ncbi:hypothetical protein ADJ79_10620 [Ottowia sp. oral taxon 894]|nr:hypothetical protein ADJ79_10620 [Ottowia sp. oral taxon 894]
MVLFTRICQSVALRAARLCRSARENCPFAGAMPAVWPGGGPRHPSARRRPFVLFRLSRRNDVPPQSARSRAPSAHFLRLRTDSEQAPRLRAGLRLWRACPGA